MVDEAERLADKLDEAVFNIVTCGPTAERIAALCAAADIVAALLRRTPAAPPPAHETADELMAELHADERRTVYQTRTGGYSVDHGGNDTVERRAIDEALERGLIKPRWPDAPPEVQWWVRIDYVEERARKAKSQEPPDAS